MQLNKQSIAFKEINKFKIIARKPKNRHDNTLKRKKKKTFF